MSVNMNHESFIFLKKIFKKMNQRFDLKQKNIITHLMKTIKIYIL
jgi:hypothetical protein